MKLKLWGWDKKPRTMLRFLKIGDIFCFGFTNGIYMYGQLIARNSCGHTAELFDIYTEQPGKMNISIFSQSHRLLEPVMLDSYSLFDRKSEGDWRIIGHQEEFIPKDVEHVFYVYGMRSEKKLVDIYGRGEKITTEEDVMKYQYYSPNGDDDIKELIEPLKSKMKRMGES